MKYLLLVFTLITTLDLAADNTSITGTVIDSKTHEPLAFTNIVVVGNYIGTVSNSEGTFVLDLTGIEPSDTILFSYVGYKILMIRADDLQSNPKVFMQPVSINLKEVKVSFRELSSKEIIKRIRDNYEQNYPELSHKQEVFFHKYEKVPFSEENQFIVKKSDFAGLDKNTIDELIQMMPGEFIEYQDAIVELYSHGGNHKLKPIEGISLEEGSQKDLFKELEDKLEVLFEDIENTKNDSDIYYKFRSGVFSQKIESNSTNDSIWNANRNDPLNYTVETKHVKNNLLTLIKDYADIDSKNWEFINKPGKYKYSKTLTLLNNEPVYEITFTPKNGGLFKGIMYVSTQTFAVLQLDFAYDEGKESETFQILGIGHAMNYKKGRIIFEEGQSGYYLKYINAQQHESASVDRDFSLMKKQKRFLTDKELNEIKMELELTFDIDSYWEMLVLGKEEIGSQQFDKAEQPLLMKFKKEYAYTPEMWSNRTVIAPSSELKEFKRK